MPELCVVSPPWISSGIALDANITPARWRANRAHDAAVYRSTKARLN
jgi:hypothetical protein